MIPRLKVISGRELLDASFALERAVPGLKFHPMGAGMAFLKNGLTATTDDKGAKAVVKWVKQNKWKASILNKTANVRRDGKWYVSPAAADLTTTHLFVSEPEGTGVVRILLGTRTVKG